MTNIQHGKLISASSVGATLVGIQPGTEPHDLSEHISRAASQTQSGEPTLSSPHTTPGPSHAAQQQSSHAGPAKGMGGGNGERKYGDVESGSMLCNRCILEQLNNLTLYGVFCFHQRSKCHGNILRTLRPGFFFPQKCTKNINSHHVPNCKAVMNADKYFYYAIYSV